MRDFTAVKMAKTDGSVDWENEEILQRQQPTDGDVLVRSEMVAMESWESCTGIFLGPSQRIDG